MNVDLAEFLIYCKEKYGVALCWVDGDTAVAPLNNNETAGLLMRFSDILNERKPG